jgi:hypothetical protein
MFLAAALVSLPAVCCCCYDIYTADTFSPLFFYRICTFAALNGAKLEKEEEENIIRDSGFISPTINR